MPAPKKAAVNTPMSRLLKANPNFAKKVKENMPKQKAKPTTTVDAKLRLMNKKAKMDEGRAFIKSGNATQNIGYKKLSGTQSTNARNKSTALMKEGYKVAELGRKTVVDTAQSYGEASRTNRRVQAQAKKAAKKTK